MKYTLGILAVLLLSISGVLAVNECSPDSGFEWCYQEINNDYGVTCHAEVQGTYPKCDGEQNGGKCVGDWYVDVKGGDDKLYLHKSITTWNGFWDNIAGCNENGCNGEQLTARQNNRIKLSDSSGKVPGYVLVGWDYESSGEDWCWQSVAGGYTLDFFDGYENVDCINGKEKCNGKYFSKCENDNWVDKNILIGKCGVECTQDIDCTRIFSVTGATTQFCSGSDIKDKISNRGCFDNICSSEITEVLVEKCDFGCEEVEGIPQCKEEVIEPKPTPEPKPEDMIKIGTPVIIGGAIILILIVVGMIAFLARKK